MQRTRPKILIISKPAIGDALLATPLISSIRAEQPDAVIDLLVTPGQEAIVEGNRDISAALTIPSHPGLSELWTIVRRLWRRYDIGICNAVDDRGHLYLWAFAKKRVAVHVASTAAWKRWITDAAFLEDDRGSHALLRNNALGNLLGYRSSYAVTPPRIAGHAGRNPLLGDIIDDDRRYAVLHLEARLPYKRWTDEGWGEVAGFLSDRGFDIYLTGGGGDEEDRYLQAVMRTMPASAVSLSGKLRFAEVSELIRHCGIYVGIDTVNSHVAAAHGVPAVVLFGPESPYRWGPWPAGLEAEVSPWNSSGSQSLKNVTIVQSDARCAFCRQGDCGKRRNRGTGCPLMTGIKSVQVTRAIATMLEENSRT